jgi:hypothetical protein
MPSKKLTYKKSDNFTMFCPSFIDDYGFTPEEFRIFSRIMRRCLGENSDGFFESVMQMAEKLQIGRDKVRKCLKVLVKCNAVRREVRPGKPDLFQFNTCNRWAPSETLPTIRAKIEAERKTPTPTDSSSPTPTKTSIGSPTDSSRGDLPDPGGVPLPKLVYEGISHEGTPIKETQEERVSDETEPEDQRFIARGPYRKLRNVTNIAEFRPGPGFDDFRDDLEEWWCKLHGIVSLPPNADTAEQVTWLFENGFVLDDLKGFYRYATTDPEEKKWRRGQLTLGAIVKGIASWKVKAKAEEAAQYVPIFCDDCRENDGMVERIVDNVRRMAKCKHANVKQAA